MAGAIDCLTPGAACLLPPPPLMYMIVTELIRAPVMKEMAVAE